MKRSPIAYVLIGSLGGFLFAMSLFTAGPARLVGFVGYFAVLVFVSKELDDAWTWHEWVYLVGLMMFLSYATFFRK